MADTPDFTNSELRAINTGESRCSYEPVDAGIGGFGNITHYLATTPRAQADHDATRNHKIPKGARPFRSL
ncbi:MAG: hypothetical protein KDH88_16915 [Chromatiales bacterium]|nr:hypothetical protein [Chromatiales bacterium]